MIIENKSSYHLISKSAIVSCLLLFSIITRINAQQLTLKSADRAFKDFAYKEALDKYLYLHRKDTSNIYYQYQIAQSYLKLNDSQNTEIWLGKLIEHADSIEINLLYEYAQVLSKNKKYSESAHWYQQFREKGGSGGVSQKLEGLNNPDQFYQDQNKFSIKRLTFNTSKSDFSPFYYDEGVAFVSSRSKQKWVKENYTWDGSNYLDFYYFDTADSLNIRKINGLNSRFHEGPAQVFDDGQKIVFTRNNISGSKLKRNSSGIVNLQIFFAERDSLGKWGSISSFKFNSMEYSLGHPTISQDGKLLIFAANIPGGMGGTDLYYSWANTDNTWSEPENMGEVINTSDNEMFPFILENQLWFASNGDKGLGGLDIYSVSLSGGKPLSEPKNIGAPINSNQDDFGLITQGNQRKGYFTSNRDGSDDIYSFTADFMEVEGQVLAKGSNKPIKNAEVTLLNKNKDFITKITTGDDGEFSAEIVKTNTIILEAKKENYLLEQPLIKNISESSGKTILEPVYMFQSILKTTVLDDNSEEPLAGVDLTLTDLRDNNILIPISSEPKEYLIVQGNTYEIVIAKEGYYTKRDTIKTSTNFSGIKEYSTNLKKIIVGESIKLDHIYYDVNSANLRHESELELDKVFIFMQDNPHIKIELGSHTDSRGSASYNLKLSQKRAESATNYLLKQGVDVTRIVPKGYGESQVMNRCSNGVVCSSEEHQQNRRTVIKILEN